MRKNIIRSAHQIATKYYIKQLKTSAQQLQKQALRLKFIKLKKLINYYLSRGTYLQTYAARLKGRIHNRMKIKLDDINININRSTKTLCNYLK